MVGGGGGGGVDSEDNDDDDDDDDDDWSSKSSSPESESVSIAAGGIASTTDDDSSAEESSSESKLLSTGSATCLDRFTWGWDAALLLCDVRWGGGERGKGWRNKEETRYIERESSGPTGSELINRAR